LLVDQVLNKPLLFVQRRDQQGRRVIFILDIEIKSVLIRAIDEVFAEGQMAELSHLVKEFPLLDFEGSLPYILFASCYSQEIHQEMEESNLFFMFADNLIKGREE
jgi:hypothetical protein